MCFLSFFLAISEPKAVDMSTRIVIWHDAAIAVTSLADLDTLSPFDTTTLSATDHAQDKRFIQQRLHGVGKFLFLFSDLDLGRSSSFPFFVHTHTNTHTHTFAGLF